MTEPQRRSTWSTFWNRGRWWKALVLAIAYFALYQAASFSVAPLLPFVGEPGAASFIAILYVVPVLLGGVILLAFGASVGWLPSLLSMQPIRGRGWMWIAVAVVLLFNVLHLLSIDYGAAGAQYVLTWLLAGLLIGFAEETLTRGYVVRIMRDAGHPELVVALMSATTFALLHASNLLVGQPLIPTLIQLVYTFSFGICMYLALRVTGTLIAPILLHASTDPSIFMHAEYPSDSPVGSLASLGNVIVIVVGIVLLLVLAIRGRRETANRMDARTALR